MRRDSCMARVAAGVALGGAVGGAVGAVYGTYEAIRLRLQNKAPEGLLGGALWRLVFSSLLFAFTLFLYSYHLVPGLLKIRHIGQTTVGSAAIFGLFLGAGSLIHCGKSY